MSNSRWLWSALLGGAMIVGCDDKKNDMPAIPPAAPAPAVPTAPTPSASGGATVPAPAITQTPAANTNKANAIASDAQTLASGTMDGTSQQAADLIGKATQYVKDNKLDLADQALKQADAMRGSLSPDMQKQLDNAHTLLNGAKAKSALSMPAMPK